MAKKKLQGQVAIVTGASRGIGAATAEMLAKWGASVVLVARSQEEIETLAARLRSEGGKAIAVAADITEVEQVEEVVESALDQFNRIDILINNAAVVAPIDELAYSDADEWTYNIFTNLVAPYLLARSVLPIMLEQESGRIINVSSGAAVRPIAGMSAYCAAKAGLDMWTKTLALELAGSRITANVLYPGVVATAMQEEIRNVDTSGTALDFSNWHRWHEEGALLPPAAAAEMLLWLAGPWSRSRSGEIFTAQDEVWLAQVRQDLA